MDPRQFVKPKRKKKLRSGESNPGRPRDRRKYLTTILLRICKQTLRRLYKGGEEEDKTKDATGGGFP